MIAGLLVAVALAAPGPAAPEAVVPPALLAPLALPEAVPARRDLDVTVLVALTVGVDGAPSDLAVVRSPGEPWSRLALEAVGGARFRPASRGGVAVAVRVVAPVPIGPRAPWEARARRAPEPVPTVAAGVRGVVVERGTRRPLPGVPVLLGEDGARGTVTDADGRFAFPDVPAGRYRLEVPPFDHEGVVETVTVPADVTLRLTANASRQYVTRVEGSSRSPADSARIVVPVERAREVPGSSGDPLKVLESLPGVARPAAAGPGAGELSIRGAAPEDTRIYLDGMPLFQLYHFGNIYSVLQDEWIGDIDFRAGGYATEYGGGIGGMVDVTLRELARDGVHGHLDVNVYHVAALVTARVSESWTVGAALRRSWVDGIIKGIVGDDPGFAFTTAPRYWDYQVRADYRPDATTLLKLVALGSDDELVLVGDRPSADDPDGGGFALGRSFHQVQGTLELALSGELAASFGLASSYQRIRVAPGKQGFKLTFDPVTARADLDWRATRDLRLRGGVLGEAYRFRIELDLPRPTAEGQVALPSEVREVVTATEDGFGGRADAWVEGSWRVDRDVTLLLGARLLTWQGNFEAAAVDGRLAAAWTPFEGTRLSLGVGVNHQAPEQQETSETLGNPALSPERAVYVDLGVAQGLGGGVSVELQGFWKGLDDLVVPTARYGGVPYDNAGSGTILGGELLLRVQGAVFDGWVAYTLSRSRRVDRPGEPERFFSFDQTHVLALVAGVQLGAGFRFGARFRYATGNPFTPLEPAYFDAGADVWVPRAAAGLLSRRSEAFLQLDIRLDKTFVFDLWRLAVYLELNNATNRANIESVGWSEDYTRRDDITSLPLTPSLGIRGSF